MLLKTFPLITIYALHNLPHRERGAGRAMGFPRRGTRRGVPITAPIEREGTLKIGLYGKGLVTKGLFTKVQGRRNTRVSAATRAA